MNIRHINQLLLELYNIGVNTNNDDIQKLVSRISIELGSNNKFQTKKYYILSNRGFNIKNAQTLIRNNNLKSKLSIKMLNNMVVGKEYIMCPYEIAGHFTDRTHSNIVGEFSIINERELGRISLSIPKIKSHNPKIQTEKDIKKEFSKIKDILKQDYNITRIN